MNYRQAREYIDGLSRFGTVLGLAVMRELMQRLGNPQETLKVIQVAGTNGKGSVLAYLQQILQQAGYRTGRYISPSVFAYREKITVNQEFISREAYAGLASRIQKACRGMNPHPTMFEAETAIAYLYFAENNCDVALIETGMGGDLDATNVTSKNLLSVIMSVSLDHMAALGNTVEEIAYHKAGIIKPSCPVVLYGQQASVEAVIKQEAAKKGSPVFVSDQERLTPAQEKDRFSYCCQDGVCYTDLMLSLEGDFQKRNAACALEAVELLKQRGFSISEDTVRDALNHTVWPGRFQKAADESDEGPLCYIDGAHNPDAAARLEEAVKKYFTKRKIIGIIGILADKDYGKVLDIMLPYLDKVITVTPANARGLDGRILMREAEKRTCRPVCYADSLFDAWNMAKADALGDDYISSWGEKPVILAFGSLSWLGDFTRLLRGEQK